MQSLALNVEVLNAKGETVNLVEEDFEADRTAEDLGINLSRNEALSADNDYPTYN
jgi:DNA-directed RNA polymerase subunit beta